MNIVTNKNEVFEGNVGDIIEYKTSSHRFHPFYMICRIEDKGFFVMSLTGEKSKARFYKTISLMLRNQNDIKKIYSRDEWQMKLEEIKA